MHLLLFLLAGASESHDFCTSLLAGRLGRSDITAYLSINKGLISYKGQLCNILCLLHQFSIVSYINKSQHWKFVLVYTIDMNVCFSAASDIGISLSSECTNSSFAFSDIKH